MWEFAIIIFKLLYFSLFFFQDQSRAALALRPHRPGRGLRHGDPLPHRLHLLQRHHGLRAHLRGGLVRRHLRQAPLDILR